MRFIRPLSERMGRSLFSGPTRRVDIGWDKSSRIDAGFSSHRLVHATLPLVAAQRFFLAADPLPPSVLLTYPHMTPLCPERVQAVMLQSESRGRRSCDFDRVEGCSFMTVFDVLAIFDV